MGVLFENRLDNTVDAGSIGIGETVYIRTKMGNDVDTGEVVASTPFGVSLNNGVFYDRDLYLFVPKVEDQKVVVVNQLNDSPDDRVAKRLRELGIDTPVFEAEKLDDKDGGEDKKGKDDDDDDDAERGGKGGEDQGNGKGEPLAKPGSSIDVDELPEDIKKSIVSTTQMDEDQLNSVLSDISDAMIKALKRVNVRDPEIYIAVGKVQSDAYRVLTGKPMSPPSVLKKKK